MLMQEPSRISLELTGPGGSHVLVVGLGLPVSIGLVVFFSVVAVVGTVVGMGAVVAF